MTAEAAVRKTGRILVVDDESDVREIIAAALAEDGHDVAIAGTAEEAEEKLDKEGFDVAFVDINLPGMSGFELLERHRERGGETAIVVITGRSTVANAIESTRRGAYDYLTKPFDLDALRLLSRQAVERQNLLKRLGRLRERARQEYKPGAEIVGQSAAMQEIYKLIGRVAASSATALIQGESGSGKELIARALHAYSDRWQGPFVAVNCSAIPGELLESEMFGHERGAFTGATDRHIGKFEQAAGGTLFLDEIADMPMPLQSKLLRVLQEREFSRVGGRELIPTDCRIVTATNRIIEREVTGGRFREDLFFRLKVVVISVPPLRERREDVPLLVDFFLDRINRQHRDVATALAQRGQAQAERGQPVVEVVAEAAAADVAVEIAQRHGHDAHAHRHLAGAPDPAQAPGLEHAQQLRLQIERQLADFVQK
jgi:two-component system nitrogen regulation response regulator GlnG